MSSNWGLCFYEFKPWCWLKKWEIDQWWQWRDIGHPEWKSKEFHDWTKLRTRFDGVDKPSHLADSWSSLTKKKDFDYFRMEILFIKRELFILLIYDVIRLKY